MAITCWLLIIGMVLTASPAFSRDRSSSNDRNRTYNHDSTRDRDGRYDSDRSRNRDRTYDNDRSCDRDGDGNNTRSSNRSRNYGNDRHNNWNRSHDRNRSKTVRVVRTHRGNALPAIVATGIVAGITFSLLDRNNPPAPTVVVPGYSPTVASPVIVTGSVVVTSGLLNLRSGPGLNRPCLRQLHRGTRLSIIGNATGWYQVRTPAGVNGWVMAQYTAPLGLGAGG
jgi:uncharacterized protein YgiM (DUF1202 family)